jgi:hypothetical protein
MPCILFVCSTSLTQPEHVQQEAERLSFRTQILQAANDLVAFLEKYAVVPGDAVHSSHLADWYKAKYADMKSALLVDFLFDPSVLVIGVIQELVTTLNTVNRFDVAHKHLLIPLSLVRSWEKSFKEDVAKDDAVLVRLSVVSTPTTN